MEDWENVMKILNLQFQLNEALLVSIHYYFTLFFYVPFENNWIKKYQWECRKKAMSQHWRIDLEQYCQVPLIVFRTAQALTKLTVTWQPGEICVFGVKGKVGFPPVTVANSSATTQAEAVTGRSVIVWNWQKKGLFHDVLWDWKWGSPP